MVGIITFHGSHNHGSMLQAYATQQALKKLGVSSEIINFRFKSQKQYYALYQTRYGAMRFFRGLLMVPFHFARLRRYIKFENFIKNRYVLSGEETDNREELIVLGRRYDYYLSGSDQIWSPYIPEFVGSKEDYTGVYYLDFVEKGKKKISYASSIGEASIEDIEKNKELLMEYDHISTREKYGSDVIEMIIGKPVKTVIDPTLLLDADEWRRLTDKPVVERKYIFLYTLQGIRSGLRWAKQLVRLGDKLDLPIICVSPFFPIVYPGIKTLVNVGPEDFLNLMDNAELVFTDSFHGTVFSIVFHKPFYSYTKKVSRDKRKRNLLYSLGLQNRYIDSLEDIYLKENYKIEYSEADKRLESLRIDAFEYIRDAFGLI